MTLIVVMKMAEERDYPHRRLPWRLSLVEGGNGMSQKLIPASLTSPFPQCPLMDDSLNSPYYTEQSLKCHVVHFVEEWRMRMLVALFLCVDYVFKAVMSVVSSFAPPVL